MAKSEQAQVVPPSLEIHLLGPFMLSVDGHAVAEDQWSRRKSALLIMLLALQPHHQLHREQVMEFLWPDLDVDAAANNLNKALHAARRALEPELKSGTDSRFIITRGQQVLLRSAGILWIDTDSFQQAAVEALKSSDPQLYERALAYYRGDLLIDQPYSDWTMTPRENLRMQHLSLLSRVAKLYEAEGQYQEALDRLHQIVSSDVANEDAHRQVMRLYAITGNRQQALHQYQQCRDDLRRELDTSPEPATEKLKAEILAGQIQPVKVETGRAERDTKNSIDSIAILPMVNSSTDMNLEYLSDGITEGIINSLSRLSPLRVLAWSSVSRYRGQKCDAKTVGAELGVRAVLTGRVLQLTDYLVVKVELVDTHDNSHLWGEQYKLKLADTFAVESEISRDISEKLRFKLTGEDRRRLALRHTENTDAYHAYLKGRYYWNKRSVEWLKKGVEHFRQAIDLDPSYASAYAGLSDSYTLLVVREAVPPVDGFAKAKAAASMALRIDDTFAEAHASLGHAMLHNWEWDEAEVALKRALEITPGYASAHQWYSELLTAMGRCDESINELKLAGELDPLSIIISADLGRAFYYGHHYDEVLKQEARTLEMEPNFWLSYINMGRAYLQKGMHAEALTKLHKAHELSPGNTEVLSFLGYAFAAAGMNVEAREKLQELNEQARIGYVPPYHLAIIHAGLGDEVEVFNWLEEAFTKHSVDLFTLKVEPMLDNLRSDERFQDLMRRVRLIR